ncbi:MAG TPA: DUF805 domain-containing protein [Tabrizicola sp.]|nr:DUF805 domain-containing protein [Tabrizicola sp.]
MGPTKAILSCLKTGAANAERASRSEFWWFTLFLALISFPLIALAALLDGALFGTEAFSFSMSLSVTPDSPPANKLSIHFGTIGTLAVLPSLLLWFRAAARRLHDCDRSGFWLWLIPVGVITAIAVFMGVLPTQTFGWLSPLLLPLPILCCAFMVIIVMLAWPSTSGPNQYGPPPSQVTQ